MTSHKEDDADNPSFATNEFMLMIGYIKFAFVWQYVFHVSDIGIAVFFTFVSGFVMMLCHIMKLNALEEFLVNFQRPKDSICSTEGFRKGEGLVR